MSPQGWSLGSALPPVEGPGIGAGGRGAPISIRRSCSFMACPLGDRPIVTSSRRDRLGVCAARRCRPGRSRACPHGPGPGAVRDPRGVPPPPWSAGSALPPVGGTRIARGRGGVWPRSAVVRSRFWYSWPGSRPAWPSPRSTTGLWARRRRWIGVCGGFRGRRVGALGRLCVRTPTSVALPAASHARASGALFRGHRAQGSRRFLEVRGRPEPANHGEQERSSQQAVAAPGRRCAALRLGDGLQVLRDIAPDAVEQVGGRLGALDPAQAALHVALTRIVVLHDQTSSSSATASRASAFLSRLRIVTADTSCRAAISLVGRSAQ